MMIIPPAILEISCKLSFKICPIDVAAAPISTKTMVNPKIKTEELTRSERLAEELLLFISSNEKPEMNEIYPGIIGKTQGEINERRPKINAVSILMFSASMKVSFFFNVKIMRTQFNTY